METAWRVREPLRLGRLGLPCHRRPVLRPVLHLRAADERPRVAAGTRASRWRTRSAPCASARARRARCASRCARSCTGPRRRRRARSRTQHPAVRERRPAPARRCASPPTGASSSGEPDERRLRDPPRDRGARRTRAVKVQNEHGAVDVADVARAEVYGSYEPCAWSAWPGAADIDSRHGDVPWRDVQGDLDARRRHGDVDGRRRDGAGHARRRARRGLRRPSGRAGPHRAPTASVTADDIHGDLEVHGEHAGVRGHGRDRDARSVETSLRAT